VVNAVKPVKRFSLQKHAHRSEYWVVVKGAAIIQIGDIEYKKQSGELVYIPAGEKHRLTNASLGQVVIIETQVGG
jgi:mannose-6-phosphate isomerase-like protein (cupin superfamily)